MLGVGRVIHRLVRPSVSFPFLSSFHRLQFIPDPLELGEARVLRPTLLGNARWGRRGFA